MLFNYMEIKRKKDVNRIKIVNQNSKLLWVIIVLLIILVVVLVNIFILREQEKIDDDVQVPNPASLYCIEQGGEVEIRENDPCLVYFSSKDVFLSGSGFVSKSLQSSGIETQKPFQGIIKAVFIIPEDQRIKFYATTGDGLYPTHKAAQCMDFEVLSASHEPYSASGDVESKVISPGDPASHTNAVLRVKILRGVINQEFNDSARNYKVRLKVVTLGGFTGSIHVGNGYDPSGSTAGRGRYTIDPRAGETHDWELGGDPNIFTDIRDKTFTHSIESHVYVNYYFEGCIRGGPGES